MANMTEMIKWVQKRTGYPRFKFMTPEEIRDEIVDSVLPSYGHYFPYKTYYVIDPTTDAVDSTRFPGLFKIEPLDCPPEDIRDVGMIFCSQDIAVGGYPRDLGRTLYGGQMSIGALLYNQLNINLMSMGQAQQITCEFVQPNMVQVYPKRRFFSQGTPLIVELFVKHLPNLSTIQPCYEEVFFRKLCEWYCKLYIYDKYKDWDDETVAGMQVRTKVQEYANAQDKIDDLEEKMEEEVFHDPDRIDFFCV